MFGSRVNSLKKLSECVSFLEEMWWKSVLKVQFLRTQKFITWRSWLYLNPFWWPKFCLDIIYVFISHGWKPISIKRSSKMRIYQVFSYRKFVTEVYLRHVQKIITWSIFIVSSWFWHQNFTNWVDYIFTEGIEFERCSKGLHFLLRVCDTLKILNAEYYFISAETSKIHNSVNFYRIGPIFLNNVNGSKFYNFYSKIEIRLCSDQYQLFIEERVRVDTGAQNKFVWAETSKIHN